MTRTITAICPYCHQEHPVEVEEREDESYECGVELDGGGTCSREVESPDERCWQHS